MIRSQAVVKTAFASKYLQQMCKHFGHKVEVSFTPEHGTVSFPFGLCVMSADGEHLTMQCDCPDEAATARAHDVIRSHLVRYAFREPDIAIEWRRLADASERRTA